MSSPPVPAPGHLIRQSQNSNRLRLPFVALVVIVLLALALVSTFFAVIAVLVAAAFVLFRFQFLVASFGWHDPELAIESDFFDLGSQPVVTYTRRSRRPTDIGTCPVETLVTCTERVRYTQGTDTRTASRVVFEDRGQGEGHGTAEGLEAELVLNISAYDGAPTMDVPDNEITWRLEVWTEQEGLPKDKHSFEIKVQPVLDRRLQTRKQDS